MSRWCISSATIYYICANGMCKMSELLKFILFPDDTDILNFHSHQSLVSELNTELNNMYK